MTRTVRTGPLSRRGLAGGMIALIGVIVLGGTRPAADLAAKDEVTPKALPADLAVIPADSFAFYTIRVADLWNDDGTKALRAQLPKQEPDIFKTWEKDLSVPLGEVERLTAVYTKAPGPSDPGGFSAVLVATTKPYDPKKVLDNVLPEAKEEKRNGKAHYVKDDGALYPIDQTAYVMGATKTVQDIMDRAGKNSDTALAPALAAAAGKHHGTIAVRPAALFASFGDMIPPSVEPYKPLREVQVAYATLDFGKETKLEARLVCTGEAEAKEAAKAARSLVALLLKHVSDLENERTPLQMLVKAPQGKAEAFKKLYKDVTTALGEMPFEAKGKEVTASLTLKADLPRVGDAVLESISYLREAERAAKPPKQ